MPTPQPTLYRLQRNLDSAGNIIEIVLPLIIGESITEQHSRELREGCLLADILQATLPTVTLRTLIDSLIAVSDTIPYVDRAFGHVRGTATVSHRTIDTAAPATVNSQTSESNPGSNSVYQGVGTAAETNGDRDKPNFGWFGDSDAVPGE